MNTKKTPRTSCQMVAMFVFNGMEQMMSARKLRIHNNQLISVTLDLQTVLKKITRKIFQCEI